MTSVFLGLGSNVGDRLFFLQSAVKLLNNNLNTNVEKVSSIYETLPYGLKEQDNFFNAALKVNTSLNIFEFHKFIKEVEIEIGRMKTVHWGPREIDIDLLFFGNEVIKTEKLKVPHPEVLKRDFVLLPLCEIEPGLIHPEIREPLCSIKLPSEEKCVISKLDIKLEL